MHEDLGFSPAKQGHKVKDQESQRVDLEIFQIHFFSYCKKISFSVKLKSLLEMNHFFRAVDHGQGLVFLQDILQAVSGDEEKFAFLLNYPN